MIVCEWEGCDRDPVTANARFCQRCYQRWHAINPFRFVGPHNVCSYSDCERRAPGKAAYCKAHQRQARESGGRMWSLVAQHCPWCGDEVNKRSNGQKAYCDPCRALRRAMRHGLEPGQYQHMLADQNGVCAICYQVDKLHIDHDHDCCPGTYSCGKCVRGLICGNCNIALGLFHDDLIRLVMAATYLQKYAAKDPAHPAHGNRNRN